MKEKNLIFRLPPEMKQRWERMCDGKNISQQSAMVALLGWLLDQDTILQSLLIGQIPEPDRGRIAAMILEKATAGTGSPKGQRMKLPKRTAALSPEVKHAQAKEHP